MLMNYYVFLNFRDYVNKTELEKLDKLVKKLGEEYRTHKGFKHFKNNLRRWHNLLEEFSLNSTLSHPPDSDMFPPPEPRNHPPDKNQNDPSDRERRPPHPGGFPDSPRPRAGQRFSLFDENKQPIIGKPFIKEQILKEIIVDDKIVGWVGLEKLRPVTNRLEADFFKHQHKLLYLTLAGILILILTVSLLLSKHILGPIKQLNKGTRELTSRRFDTRIIVPTSDELGQLASDFNMMAQTFDKYEKMQKQWITDISHELRTPLAILRGEIEAIQDGIREMNKETLDSLHSEVLRLIKLVNNLHQLSLADSQNLYIKKEPVDPVEILKEIVRLFQTRFHQSGLEIQTEFTKEKDVIIAGDEGKLAQLYSNILENTLRYTDSPGLLKIYSHLANEKLMLYFEDSAPGVPEDSMPHIFDRLYRVDKSRSRASGGSGLGLSICKQIAEIHGGSIRAADSSLNGLMIIIEFPIISDLSFPCQDV